MIKKFLILIPLFYFLVLLQTSFFVHFSLLGVTPNLILFSVILINFFAPTPNFGVGVGSAFVGGFFLDIFSGGLIGFNVLILVTLAFFIKIILRKHVRAPIIQF